LSMITKSYISSSLIRETFLKQIRVFNVPNRQLMGRGNDAQVCYRGFSDGFQENARRRADCRRLVNVPYGGFIDVRPEHVRKIVLRVIVNRQHSETRKRKGLPVHAESVVLPTPPL